MTEIVEDQLLALSKHILKVHKQLAFDNKYNTKGKVNNFTNLPLFLFCIFQPNFLSDKYWRHKTQCALPFCTTGSITTFKTARSYIISK